MPSQVSYLPRAIRRRLIPDATGSISFSEGVGLGLVAGVGIGAPILFVTGVLDPAQPKPYPLAWFGIVTGYHVLGLLIAAVIVSVWA